MKKIERLKHQAAKGSYFGGMEGAVIEEGGYVLYYKFLCYSKHFSKAHIISILF